MRSASRLQHLTWLILLIAWSAPIRTQAVQPDARRSIAEIFRESLAVGVGSPAYEISNRSLVIGSIELELEQGDAYLLTGTGGTLEGFAFEGAGTWLYRSDPPVTGTLNRLLVRHARPLADGLFPAGTAPVPLNGGIAMAESTVSSLRDLMSVAPGNHLSRIVLARLEEPSLQSVMVALQEEDRIIRYVHDAVMTGKEEISVFESGWEKDPARVQRLGISAIGNGSLGSVPALSLIHADIDLSTEDNRIAAITSRIDLVVERSPLRYAAFLLEAARNRDKWNWLGSKPNPMVIRKVLDGEGNELDFHQARDMVLVDLGRRLPVGETITLEFTGRNENLSGIHGDRNFRYFELMSTDWYPRPVYRGVERFTSRIRMRTRKPFLPIAPGTARTLQDLGTEYLLDAVNPHPAPYTMVLAGNYKTYREIDGRIAVRVHSYAHENRRQVRSIAAQAREFIRFFEDKLGGYPFGSLDIVELPDGVEFGLAGPGLIVLSRDSFHPEEAHKVPDGRLWARARLAHEIAHQWFGHKAVVASAEDRWLTESMAEYLAGLAIRSVREPARPSAGPFRRMLARWKKEACRCGSHAAIRGAGSGRDSGDPLIWRALLYNRGPLVLRMLHSMIGEEQFTGVLRTYLAMSEGRVLGASDFRTAVNHVTGEDLDWFFEQWLGEGGIPEIRITHRVEPDGQGRYKVTGLLAQAPGRNFKVVHVPIVIQMPGGDRDIRVVVQDLPSKSFLLELDERPRKVLVDPAVTTLAMYRRR